MAKTKKQLTEEVASQFELIEDLRFCWNREAEQRDADAARYSELRGRYDTLRESVLSCRQDRQDGFERCDVDLRINPRAYCALPVKIRMIVLRDFISDAMKLLVKGDFERLGSIPPDEAGH